MLVGMNFKRKCKRSFQANISLKISAKIEVAKHMFTLCRRVHTVSAWLDICSLNRGTQRRFPPKYIETPFRLPRVLLDLYKCILSGPIKFISVRSS